MTDLADAIAALGDALAEVVATALGAGGLCRAGEAEIIAALVAAGGIRRAADTLIVESVAQILDRDEAVAHADRITTRHGCRTVAELVERATRVSARSAGEIVAAATATRRRASLSTGEQLPAEFPGMREALASGGVGIDGVVAVATAFRGCGAGRVEILAADEELAAAACGTGPDAAPPASADELRALARVWATVLDQDGAEPAEARPLRRRGLTLGRRGEDGLVPIRGGLLPEVAAQLELGWDAVLNPKVDGPPQPGGVRFMESGDGPDLDEPLAAAADQRTAAQKRHDALAVLLSAAASSGELPMLGGAAPTLMVQVREEDLASGRGYAHLPNSDEPIPIAVARHVACAGVVQRVVLGDNGRIVSIVTLDRVFTHHQRRAITLRDGGCIIPGCHVRAAWCEIHHVEEHAKGGATVTDNGVLLCWFHHRTIDTGGWRIRMIDGAPYVKGPPWWDSAGRWRPVAGSAMRRRDRIALRR